jgi:maltose O-acetyltransferase
VLISQMRCWRLVRSMSRCDVMDAAGEGSRSNSDPRMLGRRKLLLRIPGIALRKAMRIARLMLLRCFELFGYLFPDCSWGCRIRGFFYRPFLSKCGKNFQVALHAKLENLGNIQVGNNVYIGYGSWVNAVRAEIILGDEVMIGPHVTIVSNNHSFRNGSARFGKGRPAPIVVGEGTWIASGCTVVAGVTIGKSCLLAAGAVACKDVPDGIIAGGVPAKQIGYTASLEDP